MKKEKVKYNLDNIDKRGASINLIWGERANGKSYQVKHKKGIYPYLFDSKRYIRDYRNPKEVIEKDIQSGKRFILMRRLREEIKAEFIEQYFMDVDIYKITDGMYNCITMYRKHIYLSNYNVDTGKTVRGEHIGYAVALSTEQNYAGGSYLDVEDIIFEEFMSRGSYLADEVNKLMNFYSTIDRKRGIVKLWLVGNTITRVCPYIKEWDLLPIITRQKQGEIVEKWLDTGDVDDEGIPIRVLLAIEHCASTGESSFIVGTHKGMLNKGEWQSDPQPLLPKSIKEYENLFSMIFLYKGFKFRANYLMDKKTNDLIWFIYPYTKEIKNDIIVFSDEIKASPYWQRDIYNPSIKNQKLCDLLKTFKENKIFYASNLCGTEFKNAIDFEIRK